MTRKAKSKFKKRYIAAALIAVDFILMPVFGIGAAAHVKDQFSNLKPAQLGSVRLSQKPGKSLYLVTSNTPFLISAQNAPGETRVVIRQSGHIFGMDIGASAQMPGPAENCTRSNISGETIIYQADKETIARRGGTLEQSVIVVINHDAAISPEFAFKVASEVGNISGGMACLPAKTPNA